MIEEGYFLITDITGYTIFLTESELDHAHNIIEELFTSQLDMIQTPLKVSNFQGDAILCYAPVAAVPDGKVILRQIEAIYHAFAAKMAAMQVNPPCGCNACANMNSLDLKMFLHYGKYMVKPVGDREELMGSDVILAHRMMKNHVVEQTRVHSYLLVTRAAGAKLQIGDWSWPLQDYQENYEHIGDVEMLVADLHRA